MTIDVKISKGKLPVYKVIFNNVDREEEYFHFYVVGSREKVIKKVCGYLSVVKGSATIRINTNVDVGFRCDLLFTLRNEYNIDIQKGA